MIRFACTKLRVGPWRFALLGMVAVAVLVALATRGSSTAARNFAAVASLAELMASPGNESADSHREPAVGGAVNACDLTSIDLLTALGSGRTVDTSCFNSESVRNERDCVALALVFRNSPDALASERAAAYLDACPNLAVFVIGELPIRQPRVWRSAWLEAAVARLQSGDVGVDSWSFYHAGSLVSAAGEVDLALRLYDRAFLMQQDVTMFHLRRSQALRSAGRFAEALAELQGVPDGQNPDVLREFAQLYLGMSDFGAAVIFAERALSTDPEDAWTWVAHGRALEGMGDVSGAYDSFVRAYRFGTDLPAINFYLGRNLFLRAQYDAAAGYLERATRLDAGSGVYWLYLARASEKLGADSTEYYCTAARLDASLVAAAAQCPASSH